MASEAGNPTVDVSALEREPHRFTLFAALRLLEQAYAGEPRLGQSRRSADDKVRLQQPPHLAFAPSDVIGLTHAERRRPVLEQYSYGVFGPNGALPLHLTEYAFERRQQFNDPTLSDFVNLFQHRLIGLFYRAWADADPATNFDRPESDRIRGYVGALIGLGEPAAQGRDHVRDYAKLARAGHYGPHARSAGGLETVLAGYFNRRIAIRQFVGEWLEIPSAVRCRLGERGATTSLGIGASLGASCWQVQHKFEIIVGPLALPEFLDFLPGGGALAALYDLVRLYTSDEWSWRVRLLLKAEEVPSAVLDGSSRLGWTSWTGGRRATANDVVIGCERAAAVSERESITSGKIGELAL
jgi:type VI secretion system protein ImpH